MTLRPYTVTWTCETTADDANQAARIARIKLADGGDARSNAPGQLLLSVDGQDGCNVLIQSLRTRPLLPATASEDNISHTLTFPSDMETTFANSVQHLLDGTGPINIRVVAAYNDDESWGDPVDYQFVNVLTKEQLFGRVGEDAIVAEGNSDELWLVLFTINDNGDRIVGSPPVFLSTYRIVHLHVL